ncbi:PREDICTED: auxin-responsive protein SAUR36-like [Nelumbo nucifera]|uniref:Auxin-responsive protein SAUR36-like n=2 Tax=Nelumbo nucifera TaxID=4432 RepID=A0A822XYC6_NELNU|nr:PREDICTED: auxin-responsive protein SAUR36-like [Nelumbo nucifera]DAD24201.1 TPA_asm: hypothetical protein HUJ06_025664 [Nelumbo nucifera]
MRKTRGFKLGRKLVKVFRWVVRPNRKPDDYRRLELDPPSGKSKAISKICDLRKCLKRGAKGLCSSNKSSASGYSRYDREALEDKPVQVPKGHMVVYVGQKDDGLHRFLVPVIYFNHPLFADLLREAEEEYGFHCPGGITIPCRIAEFESVQKKIAG